MVDNTVEMINKSISDNMDFEPRIKPIVDFKQFKIPNYDKVMRLQAQVETGKHDYTNSQNGGNPQGNTYNIELHVPKTDMDYDTAKKFASMVINEIKNTNDNYRLSVGEEVFY